ncbi:MAG: adenylate/guanylate cyclase domain-containing protein [Verrucomicrobia bacterium]|nr:adenylate/guanylate cyclase domain-containing protein [Verrucomicrobiota bacterium]
MRHRIGIHLGEVVIERVGQSEKDHARGVHDLYGLQVDLCARLMSLAGAGQILTSSLVFESARGAVARGAEGLEPVRWERHGRYALKGIDLPVEVHEVGETGLAPFWKPPGVLVEETSRPAPQAPDPEPPTPVVTPRPARRVPWVALGVGLGLLVLSGLLGWRWLSPRTDRLAILPFHAPGAASGADDFGTGLAERVEARLQERVSDSRTLRLSPLRDAVENGVTNARLAGSKLAANPMVEGSLSGPMDRRRLALSLQARAPNGAFVEQRSGDFTQKSEETLAQFEERLARQLSEWLGASGSKGGLRWFRGAAGFRRILTRGGSPGGRIASRGPGCPAQPPREGQPGEGCPGPSVGPHPAPGRPGHLRRLRRGAVVDLRPDQGSRGSHLGRGGRQEKCPAQTRVRASQRGPGDDPGDDRPALRGRATSPQRLGTESIQHTGPGGSGVGLGKDGPG